MPQLAELERFINSVGYPIAVTCALFWAIWRAGKWTGKKVIEPGVETIREMGKAHIEFLNENTRATQAGTITVGQVLSNQGHYVPMIEDLHLHLIPRPAGTTQQQVSAADKPVDNTR